MYEFIKALPGCASYADEFRSQEIDGQALMLLKEDHLMTTMSMKLGPALKICAKINSLKEGHEWVSFMCLHEEQRFLLVQTEEDQKRQLIGYRTIDTLHLGGQEAWWCSSDVLCMSWGMRVRHFSAHFRQFWQKITKIILI